MPGSLIIIIKGEFQRLGNLFLFAERGPGPEKDHTARNILKLFREMWWLNGSMPDLWSRGPGFESSIFNNDPDELLDHCVIKLEIPG